MEKAQEERNKMDALRMTIKKMTAPAVMKEALNLMGVKAGITPVSYTHLNDDAITHTSNLSTIKLTEQNTSQFP